MHPHGGKLQMRKILTLVLVVALVSLSGLFTAASAQVSPLQKFPSPAPQFSKAIAFDRTAPARNMAQGVPHFPELFDGDFRPERGRTAQDRGFSGDKARQLRAGSATIPSPSLTFEGVSNQDNFDIFGGLVAPPDPV